MKILYIHEQGSILKKSGGRLIVEKGGLALHSEPIEAIKAVMLFGNIQITAQVMRFLLEKGIDCHILSRSGKYTGTLQSIDSKNIFAKIAQYYYWNDPSKKLSTAGHILKNKMQNQIKLIEDYSRYAPKEAKQNIKSIHQALSQVDSSENTGILMGLEGSCSSSYFNFFSLICKEMPFECRSRRPAKDPVNALLNLTYSMMSISLRTEVISRGLEKCLGFLHGLRYGRDSLVLDLLEVLRPYGDRFVLTLVNKRQIRSSHFENQDENGFRLTKEGFAHYIDAFNSLDELKTSVADYVLMFQKYLMGEGNYKDMII